MEIREALEAKMDEIEAEADGAAPVPDTAAAESSPPPESAAAEPAPSPETGARPDRSRSEDGRFAKEPKKPEAKPAAKPQPVAAGVPKAGTAPVLAGAPHPAPTPAAPVLKAPQSWKPAIREKFAALPPEVQQEVIRRERETAIALQKAAEDAKGASPWQDAIRPFDGLIRQSGVDAPRYVADVLQTIQSATYGPPHQRAGALAQAIVNLGPDLLRPDQTDANGNPSCPLDRALVQMMQGRPMQAQAPQQQFRDPRLDQLLAQAQERQRSVAAQQESEAAERSQDFASSHEFFPDVQDRMADILELWAKQGKTDVSDDDLETAYSLACNMNPDVAPLLEQRRAVEAAQKAAASTARARQAASSPRSSPTAAPAAQPKGLREVLEAKADELGI